MYCDRCGTQLGAWAQFCTSCGRAVAPGATPLAASVSNSAPQGRVRRHVHRLATLWVVSGVLRLMAVGWFMLFGRMFSPGLRGWGGPIVWPFGRWGVDTFLPGGFFALAVFLGFFGVLHLVLAWGALRAAALGSSLGPRAGNPGFAAVPLRHGSGNLYTVGACAGGVRSRVRSACASRWTTQQRGLFTDWIPLTPRLQKPESR